MTLNIRKTLYGTELRRLKLPAYAARNKNDFHFERNQVGCTNLVLKAPQNTNLSTPSSSTKDAIVATPRRQLYHSAQSQPDLIVRNERVPHSVLQLCLIIFTRIVILALLEILISIERYSGIRPVLGQRMDPAAATFRRGGDPHDIAHQRGSSSGISVEKRRYSRQRAKEGHRGMTAGI